MRGIFIVLEGPDGSGTTKHSLLLEERLRQQGRTVLQTYEPTEGPIGRNIRAELADGNLLPPAELQKQFCEDRAWHLDEIIRPALAKGTVILCDRYFHSTIAYGLALGLDRASLDALTKDFERPDKTLFLLPPLSVLRERMTKRRSTDALEREEIQKKVYEEYQRLAKEDPSIIVVDTSGSVESVQEIIYQHVAPALPPAS